MNPQENSFVSQQGPQNRRSNNLIAEKLRQLTENYHHCEASLKVPDLNGATQKNMISEPKGASQPNMVAKEPNNGGGGLANSPRQDILLLKHERRMEMYKFFEKKLDNEKRLLAQGRDRLNEDIKRHQALMKDAMEVLNKQAKKEKTDFMDLVAQEIENFKLPSANKTFRSEMEKTDTLLSKINWKRH